MPTNPPRIALALLIFSLSGLQDTEEITCKNEEGEAVDWFVFYKLPKRSGKEHAESGRRYLYLDSSMRSWRKGQHLVSSNSSMLARTLEPLYGANISKNNDTAYLIYNDQVPKSKKYSQKYGHTKGVLVWDRMKGFWLIHSVPRFPPIPEDGYAYPFSGERYGQIGICITFKYYKYKDIEFQLLVLQPNIYSCSIPDAFHRELIHFPQLCANSSSFPIPWRHRALLQSDQIVNFFHFAKSSSYTNDIFTDWMAQFFMTHFLAKTWQQKSHALPSNCSLPYHVYNILSINPEPRYYFTSTQDHSKWCVSRMGSRRRWVCIGDLNRDPHQFSRAGGFICTKNRYIYSAFLKLVSGYEVCP